MLDAFRFATQPFSPKSAPTVNLTPDPKTLDGLCPDGAVNPDQYLVGWYNLRFISQWKKTTLRH